RVHSQRLVDPDPALVAAVAAALAALRRESLEVGVDAVLLERLRPERDLLLAVHAEKPSETLGDDAVEGGRRQEGRDAHLGEARDRGRGVVRVKRREDEVSG